MVIDHRESSRQQLRDALDRVQIRSAPWRPWADLALLRAAARSADLTSDDVWLILYEQGIPQPSEPRAMGPVMREGVKRRLIVATAEFRIADNPATSRNHGRPQRVYRSLVLGIRVPPFPGEQTTLFG